MPCKCGHQIKEHDWNFEIGKTEPCLKCKCLDFKEVKDRMISKEAAERKTHLWWEWEHGALVDWMSILMIVHGKQDKFIHPKSKKVHEGYEFVSLKEFLNKCVYINKGIMYGNYGIKEFFLRKASLLIPNMEVGIPNRVLPFIFRNDNMTLFIAPCTIDDNLIDKLENEEESAW